MHEDLIQGRSSTTAGKAGIVATVVLAVGALYSVWPRNPGNDTSVSAVSGHIGVDNRSRSLGSEVELSEANLPSSSYLRQEVQLSEDSAAAVLAKQARPISIELLTNGVTPPEGGFKITLTSVATKLPSSDELLDGESAHTDAPMVELGFGQILLKPAAPGEFRLRVERPGWITYESTVNVQEVGHTSESNIIQILMQPKFEIRGTVVDAVTGKGLNAFTVNAVALKPRDDIMEHFSGGPKLQQAINGKFQAAGEFLSADTVYLQVEASGYETLTSEPQEAQKGVIDFGYLQLQPVTEIGIARLAVFQGSESVRNAELIPLREPQDITRIQMDLDPDGNFYTAFSPYEEGADPIYGKIFNIDDKGGVELAAPVGSEIYAALLSKNAEPKLVTLQALPKTSNFVQKIYLDEGGTLDVQVVCSSRFDGNSRAELCTITGIGPKRIFFLEEKDPAANPKFSVHGLAAGDYEVVINGAFTGARSINEDGAIVVKKNVHVRQGATEAISVSFP